VPSTSQGRPPLLFIAPQPKRAVENLTGRISGATNALPQRPSLRATPHVQPTQRSNGRLPGDRRVPRRSVCRCDRRVTESSKPHSRPTDAFDGRPTDAVLRLMQRKASRLLSAKPTDADGSICHVKARASVAPLHIASCHAARVRRQTLHSCVCRVRRCHRTS
jgi:hypothetical protein